MVKHDKFTQIYAALKTFQAVLTFLNYNFCIMNLLHVYHSKAQITFFKIAQSQIHDH